MGQQQFFRHCKATVLQLLSLAVRMIKMFLQKFGKFQKAYLAAVSNSSVGYPLIDPWMAWASDTVFN